MILPFAGLSKHFNESHTIAYIVDCLDYELIAISRCQLP